MTLAAGLLAYASLNTWLGLVVFAIVLAIMVVLARWILNAVLGPMGVPAQVIQLLFVLVAVLAIVALLYRLMPLYSSI